jgi:hypothetical protein
MQYLLMASYPHCLITLHRGQEPRLCGVRTYRAAGGVMSRLSLAAYVEMPILVVLVLGWDEYFASTVVDAPPGHWWFG